MTPGVSTWEDLGPIPGNVLLAINSAPDNPEPVAMVLASLARLTGPSALHVIAVPRWLDWLDRHGVSRDRILASADAAGLELELNHFLESPSTVHWALQRRFSVIAGSAAHSLYNEEIKTIFEQGACLLGQDALFIAHCLPLPFLYALDYAEFLERFGRDAKQAAYESLTRAMVDDLYRLWITEGRPAADDSARSTGAFGLVTSRLEARLERYDEDAVASLESRRVSAGSRDLTLHLRDVIHNHAEQWHLQTREIARLQAVVDERNAAVLLRDNTVDALRNQLQPVYRKMWRLVKKARQ